MLLPVIMAGGTGSRLWPLSRELYPKTVHQLARTALDAAGDWSTA